MNFETVHQMMNDVNPGTKKPKYQRILVGYQDDEAQEEEQPTAAAQDLELDLKIPEGLQEQISTCRDTETTDEHSQGATTSEQFDGLKQIVR